MVLGLRGTWVEACQAVSLASLLAAPVLLPSCGSSSRRDELPTASAGKGSGGKGSGGSSGIGGAGASGGRGSSGASASGGNAGRGAGGAAGSNAMGGSGGGGAGLTGSSGASAGMSVGANGGQSGEAGSSGSGSGGEGGDGAPGGMGPGPAPGFACGVDHCDVGERCTFCDQGDVTVSRCTPDPDDDPSGYQAATTDCIDLDPEAHHDCDGPEDCESGEYCAWGVNPGVARLRCVSEVELPDPVPASCCFSCGALPECVLCWTTDDCPDPYECKRDDPFGVGGCRPPG